MNNTRQKKCVRLKPARRLPRSDVRRRRQTRQQALRVLYLNARHRGKGGATNKKLN